MFGVSPLDVDGEVSQLTLDRLTLLRGIMQGFARLYDVFEPAPPSTVPGALNQGLKRLGDVAQGAASAVSGAVSGAGWSALEKRANLAQPVVAPEEQGADVRFEVAHPVGFAFAEWSRLFAILVVV